MVSLINFGSISTVNGKTVLSGSQSGIDTAGLVDTLAKAKRLPAVAMETSIKSNTSKITALTSLKTALTTLQSSLNALRNPGGLGSNANVFSARTAYLSSLNGNTPSDYVGVTTANGAPIGKYTLKVNQLAASETRQSSTFADRTTSVVEAAGGDTAGKFSAGTFKINGFDVTFNEGDNLNNINAAINSITSKTGVTSSIVKLADNDYRIVLSSKNPGTANAINITDPDGVLPTTPMFTVTQPAQNAEIEFNGETVIRSTNKITDLVENVTFSLYQPTVSGDKITLEIDKNNATIATAIGTFIDSYNQVRIFSAEQNQRGTDGKFLDSAVLNNDSTMNTIVNQLSSLLNGQVSISIPNLYSSGNALSAPSRLGDIGVNLDNYGGDSTNPDKIIPATSNILTADASKIQTMLETYFDKVQNIFQYDFTASSASISSYKRDNTVTQANFTIAVDESQPTDAQKAKITQIDGINLVTPIDLEYTIVNGQKIISAPANSALAGMSFIYTGNGNDTVQKSNPVSNKDFTIDIDSSQPEGSQAKVTKMFGAELATPIALKYTVNGSSTVISGNAGTSFSGLSMIYTGDGTDEINISLSQGIADKIYNALDGMLTATTGQTSMIDQAIESLKTSNDKLQERVDKIDDDIVTYRDKLLAKYSAVESAIAAANQLLLLLGAQQDARNNAG